MPNGASERLRWAVEQLDLTGSEKLLEIGCGHGVAASLVCERLSSGSLLALDRSGKMVAAAIKRNAEHVSSGKASFVTASLTEADFGTARFDKIFAVRVGAFIQGDAARELGRVRNLLAAGGRFYLIYDPPHTPQVEGVVAKATAALEQSGMRVLEVRRNHLTNSDVVCIVTTAP